jgi:hypothetical protein
VFLVAPLLIGSLFLGALAAAIPLPQYFYARVPLIVIGLAVAIAKTNMSLKADYVVLLMAAIVCFSSTAIDYRYLIRLFRPDQWATIKVHNLGRQLATVTGKGRITCLASILPLEGGVLERHSTKTLASGPRPDRWLESARRRQSYAGLGL